MECRFTLVPSVYFTEEKARRMLEEVVHLDEDEPLSFLEIPPHDAVLVYAGSERPRVYDMLLSLCKIRDYNKIIMDFTDGVLYLTVAQGDQLRVCNAFAAEDFVTAEYYLFSALKSLQINPEISTVYSMEALSQQQCISLCSYFKNAETLQ